METFFEVDWESILRIIGVFSITFVLSFLVGFERQNTGKDAGISAHVLVALGTCALGILQQYMYRDAIKDTLELSQIQLGTQVNIENQRIVSQVITGIGFLGAGVIMKSEKHIVGLTTATTIWIVAILGLILGSGYITIGLLLGASAILFIYIRDFARHINPFRNSNGTKEKEDTQA